MLTLLRVAQLLDLFAFSTDVVRVFIFTEVLADGLMRWCLLFGLDSLQVFLWRRRANHDLCRRGHGHRFYLALLAKVVHFSAYGDSFLHRWVQQALVFADARSARGRLTPDQALQCNVLTIANDLVAHFLLFFGIVSITDIHYIHFVHRLYGFWALVVGVRRTASSTNQVRRDQLLIVMERFETDFRCTFCLHALSLG